MVVAEVVSEVAVGDVALVAGALEVEEDRQVRRVLALAIDDLLKVGIVYFLMMIFKNKRQFYT